MPTTRRRPNDWKIPSRSYYVLLAATFAAFLLMTGYVGIRVLMVLFDRSDSAADTVMAVLLLGAELFLCMHGVG
jgi:hypothetical protein